MPARLSRKRYTEITRYLKAVIADKTKPDRLRMAAVESLLEVYARHDRSEAERVRRKAAEGAQGAPQPAGACQAADAQEESTEQFLERLRRRTEETSTNE